jgi:Spy/CpxP family protein refolding chaperone
MKAKTTIFALVMSLCAWGVMAQDRPLQPRPEAAGGHQPPPQAYEDCRGKKAGDTVQHTTPQGTVPATCVDSPQGLVARPNQPPGARSDVQPRQPLARQGPEPSDKAQRYSIEQAISDQAQLHTIAFDGLAILTGDFGLDTFLPPGKVSDYFGFQCMRDIDANGGGHNTSFLTRIANNKLAILNDDQKAHFVALAKEQENDIRLFAEKRLPLIKAFRQNLTGDLPAGSKGLDENAVVNYSADLYVLDGLLAFQRAKVMGSIIRGLNDRQKAAVAMLKFGDSRTWPDLPEQLDKKSMSHEVNVAMMTYASEMFSWYAGSVEADTYFCPERHGMYFGGFGMKTAPAMGKQDYSISTSLTGDRGEAFLAALTDAQRKRITGLVDLQRQDLDEIVRIRRAIATELRRFHKGESADKDKVLSLSKRYGELDGEMSYLYATAFAKVGQTLTTQQKAELNKMRTSNPSEPKGPFLYSSPIEMPKIASTDFLFGVLRSDQNAPSTVKPGGGVSRAGQEPIGRLDRKFGTSGNNEFFTCEAA